MSRKQEVTVSVRYADGGLDFSEVCNILGWYEMGEKEKEVPHLVVNIDGDRKKIRFKNNKDNRPFRKSLADRYSNEMKRGKWAMNGESIIIDSNGMIVSGAHRLAGFCLAELERRSNTKKFAEHYHIRGEMKFPAIIVRGVDPDTADSVDLGQKRSGGDVLFRRHEFKQKMYSEADKRKLAYDLSVAARLVWLRVGGKQVSDAPHFPHSEMLEFIESHPEIKEAVEFIYSEDGESRISNLISRGYAAGLMYLMATSASEPDEKNILNWEQAEKFWILFASGANLDAENPVLVLRNALISSVAGSAGQRDAILGMVVKAWNAYHEGKVLSSRKSGDDGIKLRYEKNDLGRNVLVEFPRMGGLDIEVEKAEEDASEITEEASEEKPVKQTKKESKSKKTAKKASKKGSKKESEDEISEEVDTVGLLSDED